MMTLTRFLPTAAALLFLFPLGSGAVPGTKRELPADSLARAGVTGRDLAVQVASGHAWGLRGHHRHRTNKPLPERFNHPFVAPADRDGGGATPVPEPSRWCYSRGACCWLARW